MYLDSTDTNLRSKVASALIEQSQDLVTITAADGTILFKSAFTQQALGYTPRELDGKNIFQLIDPAERVAATAYFNAVLKGETHTDLFEYRMMHRDGAWRYFTARITLLDEPINGETCLMIVSREVTRRKQAEAYKTAIFENALDAIVTMNGAGQIVEWNAAAERLLGYTREEAVGRDLSELIIPAEMRAMHNGSLAHYIATGKKRILGERVEVPAMRCGGELVNVELIVIELTAGPEPLFAGFMRDLTDQKRAEAALLESKVEAERAREEAERANLAKSEFLSRMSHELRTPLNAIMGFSQILQMDEDAAPFRDLSDDIYDAGKHLLGLINEVLDISRIEAGTLSLSVEPVALGELMNEAMALIAPLAAARGLTLRSAPVSGSVCVLGDRQRLMQCLLNVLANAVKYNRDGGRVEIEFFAEQPEAQSEGAPAGYTTIRIRDTGVGVPPEKMSRLFTPFDRLDAEQTEVEGTGLGLALTKRLIEEMNGELSVESTPGVGSVFSLRLPTVAGAPTNIAIEEPLPVFAEIEQQRRLLLIEDNPRNVRVIEKILERRADIALMTAMSGSLGLELAREHCPDAIILDLHLPDIGGHEVLCRLREGRTTQEIPVVVLSADATTGQIERLKNAGAHEYLTKPLDVAQFFSTLDDVLR